MEETVIKLEHEMWEAVLRRDTEGFKALVSPDAVMVCGGYRCLGSEYASFIADFGISGYSITKMEVIRSSDSQVVLHYVLCTQAENADSLDLAGLFHVVSIWEKRAAAWNLVFNMDARITPPAGC